VQCLLAVALLEIYSLRVVVSASGAALTRFCNLQSAGDDKQALVYLGMKRSREQARNKLLQSLVGLLEAQEVSGNS
jgi:hypothetical protein